MLKFLLLLLFLDFTTPHHPHHHHHHNHGHGHDIFLDFISELMSNGQRSTTPTTTPSPVQAQSEESIKTYNYGPSIVSLTKYNKDVHGPTIFHPDTGRTINLSDYPNYSVIIPLTQDSPTATSNQVFVSRRLSGPGEFHVIAPEGHGIMAVIQSMDLRTAPTGCNDFIQFGDVDSGVDGAVTCGKVDVSDGSFSPSSLVGERVFLSPSGNLRVLFYHGYIWGLVRDFNFDILDPSRNHVLKVEIVLTAYKECESENVTNGQKYKSCSNIQEGRVCIPAKLFCDRIINCAFEENFGSDEYLSNCLPDLLSLLLPQVRQSLTPRSRPSSTTQSPSTVVVTSSIFTPSSSTTEITTTSTTPTPTTTTTTTSPTKTTTSTTTSPPTISTTSTTTSTTTYRPSVLLESGIKVTPTSTGIPFRTLLHEHLFDISPQNIVVVTHSPRSAPRRTTTTRESTTTVSPTSTVFISESSSSIRLPPEFEQAVNFLQQQKQETSITNLSFKNSSYNNKLQILQPNMTFTDNTLAVEEDEGQVEQLESFTGVNDDANYASDNHHNKDTPLILGGISLESEKQDEGDASSIILLIISVFIILLVALYILRIYCCRNRVVWIPNPKSLRVRRKRRETSVYSNSSSSARGSSNFPEIHISDFSDGSLKKERNAGSTTPTPPSYDKLFPKSSLQNADVLP